eukprot:TRINITY_DN908_c0_g1_i15.p1 TRINITY_DN908_c0_g1~~TRINITY_DN908_c0_g1_i15.p1  ORF type:complete len:146 (+),score=0.51 TRINITY_DN908_c0_g1_i15:143-580(+)
MHEESHRCHPHLPSCSAFFCAPCQLGHATRASSIRTRTPVCSTLIRARQYMLRPSLVSTKAVPSSTHLNSEFFTTSAGIIAIPKILSRESSCTTPVDDHGVLAPSSESDIEHSFATPSQHTEQSASINTSLTDTHSPPIVQIDHD